jgi:DNA-binding IscR family transcriptional regulator
LQQPLLNVVRAVDGVDLFASCAHGLKQCSEIKPCPFHYEIKDVRTKMLNTFKETTIEMLVANLEKGMVLMQ